MQTTIYMKTGTSINYDHSEKRSHIEEAFGTKKRIFTIITPAKTITIPVDNINYWITEN